MNHYVQIHFRVFGTYGTYQNEEHTGIAFTYYKDYCTLQNTSISKTSTDVSVMWTLDLKTKFFSVSTSEEKNGPFIK
jgi:hypothetical protein